MGKARSIRLEMRVETWPRRPGKVTELNATLTYDAIAEGSRRYYHPSAEDGVSQMKKIAAQYGSECLEKNKVYRRGIKVNTISGKWTAVRRVASCDSCCSVERPTRAGGLRRGRDKSKNPREREAGASGRQFQQR